MLVKIEKAQTIKYLFSLQFVTLTNLKNLMIYNYYDNNLKYKY